LHKKYIEDFEKNDLDKIINISQVIIESLRGDSIIYICGNGGSAADAQHIAGEFIGRFKCERKALPAIALATNTPVITCIGNDYGFDNIYKRQVEALLKKGDILWALSTSGCSPNIIEAVKTAREKGAKVISFTGVKGSKLEAVSDICLNINTDITAVVQEVHQLAYHLVCDLVENGIFKNGNL